MEQFVDVSAVLGSGVYILAYRGKVVYVGKTSCLVEMIAAHRRLAPKHMPDWFPVVGVLFDAVSICPCRYATEAAELAESLISQYLPRYNIRGTEPTTELPCLTEPTRPSLSA